MDFWDLTKLLVRRWVIVVPMLLLSVGACVATVVEVKPDYDATAYVQLVGPVTGGTAPGAATPDQRNPWLALGLQTIGNAAIVTMMDRSVLEELKAEGYSDSYTLTMASDSPLITFEIVGTTIAQARDTAEQLVSRFTDSVAQLQRSYGVQPADFITARRLDQGTNVARSSSKIKRALVAVAGAGLMLTAGLTVGLDAWLRRRKRRKEEAAQLAEQPIAGAAPPPAAPPRVAAAVVTRSRINWDVRPETERALPIPANTNGSASSDKTTVIRTPDIEESPTEKTAIIRTANGIDGAEAPTRDVAPQQPLPSDATIVLPMPMP